MRSGGIPAVAAHDYTIQIAQLRLERRVGGVQRERTDDGACFTQSS